VLQNEPTHLLLCSKVRDGSILAITEDRAGVANFLEQNPWNDLYRKTIGKKIRVSEFATSSNISGSVTAAG
jgi:hypothetical protein